MEWFIIHSENILEKITTDMINHKHVGSGNKERSRFDESSPEELARQCYAKGEISKEDLNEILDNLSI